MSLDTTPAADLAAIKPLTLRGVTPAPVGERPENIWVRVADLRIDRRYQRRISARGEALIREMVAGWDWTLVQAITVAELPGGLWELIDGQHRATAAATHGGIALLPAMVIRDPLDTAAAARAFVKLNSRRVSVSALQSHRAAVVAGAPEATALRDVAEAASVKILTSNRPACDCAPGDTLAVSACYTALRRHGADTLRAALKACRAAQLAPICSEHIAAVTLLLAEWGLDAIDPTKLVAALRDWQAVLDAADLAALENGQPKARTRAVEMYRRAGR